MPRRRPPRVFPERVTSAIESMIPGTLGGRVSSAAPTVRDDVAATVGGNAGVVDQATGIDFYRDRYDLGSDGAQDVALTYLPVENSEHVYLNGVEQDEGVDWTRDDATVSLLSTMGALTDDVLDVRYAYRFGAPVVPEGEPTPVAEVFTQVSPPNQANATSVVATFATNVTAGSTLVVLWVGQFSRSVTSMSGCGATWTQKVRVAGGAFSLSCEIWVGTGATTGTAVTATHNSGSAQFSIMAAEMKAGYTGTVRTTSGTGPTTSAAPVTASIVPVVNEVVIGLAAKYDNTQTFTGSPSDSPGPWEDFADSTGGVAGIALQVRSGYRVALSTSAHQRQYALTAAAAWVGATIVIT
jgi:hypothetical protein